MLLSQGSAATLETIIRSILKCERYGIGGYVNSDVIRKAPMEVVALCIGLLYRPEYDEAIEGFVFSWRDVINNEQEESGRTEDDFVREFNTLLSLITNGDVAK